MTTSTSEAPAAEQVALCTETRDAIFKSLARVIVGQREVVDQLLIALFTRGHVLLEGVPGLAKTLLVSTLARTLGLKFSRIQFTPDLMPADITGIDVVEEDRVTGRRDYRFLEGPVFAHVVLADEINRTPPKTQAAMLEAMQERSVTIGRTRHVLPDPFFVLATQNPLEHEGTYPLPEAQQDRFMFKILVDYPSFDEELAIAKRSVETAEYEPTVLTDSGRLAAIQSIVRHVPVADYVLEYAVTLVRKTRPNDPLRPDWLRDVLRFGAGPRAVEFLVRAAQARAVLNSRFYATCSDVRALARPVLRHRLGLSFLAASQGATADGVIDRLLDQTPEPVEHAAHDARFQDLLSS